MNNKKILSLIALAAISSMATAQPIPQLVTVDQYKSNSSRTVSPTTSANTSTSTTSNTSAAPVVTSIENPVMPAAANANTAVISDTLEPTSCVSATTWNTYMQAIQSNASYYNAIKTYAEQFSKEASGYQQLLTENNIQPQWPMVSGTVGSMSTIDVAPLNDTFKNSPCPPGQYSGASVNKAVELANTYRSQGNSYKVLQGQWDAQAKSFQQQAKAANLQLAAPTFTEGPKAGEDLGYYLSKRVNVPAK